MVAKKGIPDMSQRRRADMAAMALRRRADVGSMALRRRSDFGPMSGRCRCDGAATSLRCRCDGAATSLQWRSYVQYTHAYKHVYRPRLARKEAGHDGGTWDQFKEGYP